ncbi:MAG: T9SS type A sorting domain-containing protein [Saprospiraceae bacterium]
MPTKKITAAALLSAALCLPSASAQWRQTGGFLTLSTGTELKLTGALDANGGSVANGGQVYCTTLSVAPGSALSGAGIWNLSGNLNNSGGSISNSAGEFWFVGSTAAQINAGSAELYKVRLAKSGGGVQVNLAAPLSVVAELRFTSNNNKLILGNFDFTLGASGTVAGANNTKFVVTTGSGRFVKKNVKNTNFNFPVGATTSTYNVLTIKNSGTADDIGVRCQANVLSGGGSGTPILANAVDASWEITEATAGGSNLTLTASWYATDELAGFDRANCAIRQHNGSSWAASATNAASGTNPYTRQRSGITSLGHFAVFDGVLLKPTGSDRTEQLSENQSFEISENALSLFPNPTADWLNLRLPNEAESLAEIRVVDSGGRTTMLSRQPQPNVPLNVSALPDGMYRLLARTVSGRLLTASFMKSSP